MATRYGKDYRLKIKTGAATFILIGGEQQLTRKGSSREIDTSSKDDGLYETSGQGQKKITLSVSGKVKLPDEGLEAVYEAQKSAVPEGEFQIVHVLTGAVVFQAPMSIGNWSDSFNNNEAVPYSFDLNLTAAPTIDDIAATI